LREKVPLFGLSLAVSLVTFLVQLGGGALMSLESIPLSERAANALISYMTFLVQLVWPAGLAIFYPYPVTFPAWRTIGAAGVLIAISVLVWRARDRRYLATGWAWYLGTLVPVIGLVQVGEQAHADRYTYIPLIGVRLMIVWGVEELTRRWPRGAVAALAGAACCAYAVATWLEIGYWRNSETLMRRAIAVTPDNYVAHDNLGEALRRKRHTEEAIAHFREAVRIRPTSIEGHTNLGEALIATGRIEEACRIFARHCVSIRIFRRRR
jgi:tetratricopeptide (TPR) repeat protein